jgi:hypothetical protein
MGWGGEAAVKARRTRARRLLLAWSGSPGNGVQQLPAWLLQLSSQWRMALQRDSDDEGSDAAKHMRGNSSKTHERKFERKQKKEAEATVFFRQSFLSQ